MGPFSRDEYYVMRNVEVILWGLIVIMYLRIKSDGQTNCYESRVI